MFSLEEAPILVVAALSYELASINGAAHPGLVLLETGEGVANAKRHLESWLEQRAARAVLSIGFAGALSASLQVGDLVIAREIRGLKDQPDGNLLSAARQVQIGVPVHIGVALTSHNILWKAESKRALAGSLGANEIGFVDMESTAIAGVCASRGVPLLIIRSISDLLDEDLPLDFNQYRNRDGRVDPRKVVNAALLRPTAFKRLFELRRRSMLCAGRLAEFVERLVMLISQAA
jgi:adenosylhomocysteine nucleosidase